MTRSLDINQRDGGGGCRYCVRFYVSHCSRGGGKRKMWKKEKEKENNDERKTRVIRSSAPFNNTLPSTAKYYCVAERIRAFGVSVGAEKTSPSPVEAFCFNIRLESLTSARIASPTVRRACGRYRFTHTTIYRDVGTERGV